MGRLSPSKKRLEVPIPSSEAARQRMLRVGQRDTAPELAIRRHLFAMGYRYRVDRPPLEGLRRRADLVFAPLRLAVYVDGCFWHACPLHATWPKENARFWRAKIEANERRDRDTDARLAAVGWSVIRVWEHEEPAAAAERIDAVIRGLMRSPSPESDPGSIANLQSKVATEPYRWHSPARLLLPARLP